MEKPVLILIEKIDKAPEEILLHWHQNPIKYDQGQKKRWRYFKETGFTDCLDLSFIINIIQRNKVMNIVITGASKGMGKALASKFATPENNIFICARNENELANAAQEIKEKNNAAHIQYFAADLSEKISAEKFTDWLTGQNIIPDILINNAGNFIPGSIYNEEEGTLEKMIAVNLYSAYYVTRAFLPSMMKKKSGHIFNMCSIA